MTESAVYVVEKMAHGYKRMGRDAGKGFYDYDSEPIELWSGLKTFERKAKQVSAQDVRDRLLFSALISALSQAQHQGHDHPNPLLGSRLPVSRSQAQGMVQQMGEAVFADRCTELVTRFGNRFAHPGSHGH